MSVTLIQELAAQIGLDGLAKVEVDLVRQRPVPPRLVARLFREENTALTPREREVMVLLTSGFKRQEIADELGISFQTVICHLRHSYAKLGAHRQIEAVNVFLESAA
jgi:DNA-binding NarL/FixJ family response regulator